MLVTTGLVKKFYVGKFYNQDYKTPWFVQDKTYFPSLIIQKHPISLSTVFQPGW